MVEIASLGAAPQAIEPAPKPIAANITEALAAAQAQGPKDGTFTVPGGECLGSE